MTLMNAKLTPEAIVTIPRRSAATPNSDGRYALYTVSKYSLESHSGSTEIRVLDVETGASTLFSDDEKNKEPQWLVGSQVLWTRSVEGGKTEIWIGTAGSDEKNAYVAGIIAAPITALQTKELADGSIAVAFNAQAKLDGSLYNFETAPKPHTSAREYDSVLIRFWSEYYTAERSSIWYTTLKKLPSAGRYKLSSEPCINALKDTGLECPAFIADPFNGVNFDISLTGLLFTTRDPESNPAIQVHFKLYYIPLCSFTESPAPRPHNIHVHGYSGAVSKAVFSSNGEAAAFLMQKSDDNRYVNNHVFVIGSIEAPDEITAFEIKEASATANTTNARDQWDYSPQSIVWANNSKELYVIAAERARAIVWKLPVKTSPNKPLKMIAEKLTEGGAVSRFKPLTSSPHETRLFINKTTLTDNGLFIILDTSTGAERVISSASNHGSALGLRASQVSEIYFKGQGDYECQAWVTVPSDFDENKKYPVAFLIHGGPGGSWTDAWSIRWNPAVFAEQGYVVVTPNPTGSDGFGQAYNEGVRREWGGRPYNDIVNCFEHVSKHMPYADTDRAVGLGGSYGGYLVNWIAGQPLGKKFKALVCHDGIFSLYNMYSSDYTQSLRDDMGGDIWNPKAKPLWDKWDPAQHTQNWSTPMLFIHSDGDYRCPITEGLAPFSVCQQRGIESRFLNFPDETHFVSKRENSLFWYHTVIGWMNKYVGMEGGIVLKPPVSEPKYHWQKSISLELRDRV